MPEMELTPRLKTAILLISLPADAASAIMRSFSPEEMKAISAEMAKARTIPPEVRAKVVQEFLEKTSKTKKGTTQVSASPATQASAAPTAGKGKEKDAPVPIAQNLQSLLGARTTAPKRAKVKHPFAFLLDVDPKKIAYVLKDEDPQTVAAILGNLPAPVATKILAFLPASIQSEVPKRIQNLSKLSEEVMRALVEILQEELENVIPTGPATAREHSSELVSHLDKVTERKIIEKLGIGHPISSHIRGRSLEFEDIMLLDQNGIRELIRITDTRDLLIALKGAPMELVNKILSVLPPQKAKALMEDLKVLQDVSEQEIKRAQQQIRNNLRGLITIGKIKLPGS